MKNTFLTLKSWLIFAVTATVISNCSSTKNPSSYKGDLSSAEIKNRVATRHFIFVAESVNPLRGRFRNLTSRYDVKVSPDTLTSFLPYFGRAFSATIGSTEGGIKFTSTAFSYEVKPGKKDQWDLVIKPKDQQDVQQLNFTVFGNGSASLTVTSTSRDPISFGGHLEK